MRKYLATLLMMALFLQCDLASASGHAGNLNVEGVTTEGDGVFLIVSPNALNPDACNSAGYIAIPAGPLRDVNISLALNAMNTRAPVSIWVSECHWGPGGASVPRAYHLTIGR